MTVAINHPSNEPDFLFREGRLDPSDASVALLVLDDGRYLMQLRDQKPGIFFPGHWGLFGGALDPGETAERALRRELREELGLAFEALSYFTHFIFDFAPHGSGTVTRTYFEVQLALSRLSSIRLGEGADFKAFTATEIAGLRVTPYDAFALWMHVTRHVAKSCG